MTTAKRFQVWFQHSSDRNSSLIDSFDTVMGAVEFLFSRQANHAGSTLYPHQDGTGSLFGYTTEMVYYSEIGQWGFRYWLVDSSQPAPVAKDLSQTALDYAPEEKQEMTTTIEQQLEIWRDNTPVWKQFPEWGQSAIYVLGLSAEYCDPDEQPAGVIIVFGGRSNRMRIYQNNERNKNRVGIMAGLMGLTDFGYINWLSDSKKLTPSYAYCNGAPQGVAIPHHDAILYACDGCVVWNNGIVGYVQARGEQNKFTGIELDWSNRVIDTLRGNKFTCYLWGHYVMNFFPVSSPATPETDMDQIPYNVEVVDAICASNANWGIKFNPSSSQIVLLDEQLMYWRNRRALAELCNDPDDEEYCSLFVLAVEALILV